MNELSHFFVGIFSAFFAGIFVLAALGVANESTQEQGYGWGRTFIAQTDGNLGQAVSRCRDHNAEHHGSSTVWLGGCVKGVHGDE